MEKYYVKVSAGKTCWYRDSKCKVVHRIGGPAVVQANGDKWWCVDNNFHREDGPAILRVHGDKWYFINGKLHRSDGPAIDLASGTKKWYVNGQRHRTDGPAIEWGGGSKQWFIDDNELTEAEFNARNHPACVDKTITIDGVNYKLTKI